jgi:hypothetical protein
MNARQRVLEEVRAFSNKGIGVTRQTVAASLSWPINRVSGRITELKKEGLVSERGTICTHEGYTRGLIWLT